MPIVHLRGLTGLLEGYAGQARPKPSPVTILSRRRRKAQKQRRKNLHYKYFPLQNPKTLTAIVLPAVRVAHCQG